MVVERPDMVAMSTTGFVLSDRAEARLREEAFAQVRQGHGITDEIRKLKIERYGVSNKRSGFGKFMDSVKLNRKWNRQLVDPQVMRERTALGGLIEIRGFHKTGPWVPGPETLMRPPAAFEFTATDAKMMASCILLGGATGVADQSPEDKARWDLALDRLKALYELDAETPMEVVQHLAPGRDFSTIQDPSVVKDFSALEMAGIRVYEMTLHSESGYFPVFPWDPPRGTA